MPTNMLNTSISGMPGDDHVMLLYPPKDKTIKVMVTQNDASRMLNCTVSGSNLANIKMSWMYNKEPIVNNFTQLLNGRKVSYVLAEIPGVYECIVRPINGVFSSGKIAGIFEVVMSGKTLSNLTVNPSLNGCNIYKGRHLLG